MLIKRATIKDVAREANFSPSTVSRYLNHKISLPEGSARRIDEARARLNYQPNATAQNLLSGTTKMIGLIVPDITNPFFSTLAAAAEATFFAHGYSVLLCNTETDSRREHHYLDFLTPDRVDGILFLSNNVGDEAIKEKLAQHLNVVLLDEDIPDLKVSKVLADNETGGYLATRYLLEQGHRQIAYVGGHKNLYSSELRFRGYLRALQEFEVGARAEYRFDGPYTYDFGASVFATIQSLNPMPTAIFAASDYSAIGILSAAAEAQVSVPEDLSLVGFDDIPVARFLWPPLTTIRQPIKELGRRGAELLLGRIQNKAMLSTRALRLPVELVIRRSVAPRQSIKG